MPIWYILLRGRRSGSGDWRLPFAVLVVAFFGGWVGLWLTEPATNDIIHPSVYWWYFEATITTLGYGGPVTLGGRIIAGTMMVLAIAAFTQIIGITSDKIKKFNELLKRGLVHIKAQDHIVIFGYSAGRTEGLVHELGKGNVILAATAAMTGTNPMPGIVEFAAGVLDSDDLLLRASIAAARTIIVDVADDDHAIRIALAVRAVNANAHIIVAIVDIAAGRILAKLPGHLTSVSIDMPTMVASEALYPGTATILANLANPTNMVSIRWLLVPTNTERSFADVAHRMIGLGGALLAIGDNGTVALLPCDQQIRGGMRLFYAHAAPLSTAQAAALWQ
jgi:voltage-gated potassium channel